MHQGNWTCSKCGCAITELPFEPKSDKGLVCRSCYTAQKNDSAQGEQQNGEGGEENAQPNTEEKKMFEGDWKCADCGNPITKLPFEPKSTNNLRCVDCFKKSRG